jgi:putative Mn2+ efflux pump MntP
MQKIEFFLIGIGLSADAFAVSISNGLCMKKLIIKKAFLIALMFGFSQALMPFLGFIFGSAVSSIIARYAPFVALALLGFIGGRMVIDGLVKKQEIESGESGKNLSIGSLMIQAVATSIDALIAGVSFVAIGITWNGLFGSIAIIGSITFCISFTGVIFGKQFNGILGNKAKIIGGLILVGIGIKAVL